jgi:predicted amidohydrolase YtcJ
MSQLTQSNHPLCLADLLIRAGAIYSIAQDRKVYQAIAIRDEWIVFTMVSGRAVYDPEALL